MFHNPTHTFPVDQVEIAFVDVFVAMVELLRGDLSPPHDGYCLHK